MQFIFTKHTFNYLTVFINIYYKNSRQILTFAKLIKPYLDGIIL